MCRLTGSYFLRICGAPPLPGYSSAYRSSIALVGVGALFWDVAVVDANQLWLVSDIDTDGNLATASDREIYLYKRTAAGWAAPIRLTNNAVIDSGPLLSLTPAGQPVVAWHHRDSVLGLVGDPANTQPQVWSQPLPLFERPEQRRALSASILPDGDIVLALAAVTLTNETVTFVFACNDTMAIGALAFLHEANIAVPEEVSVIGFDNIL